MEGTTAVSVTIGSSEFLNTDVLCLYTDNIHEINTMYIMLMHCVSRCTDMDLIKHDSKFMYIRIYGFYILCLRIM